MLASVSACLFYDLLIKIVDVTSADLYFLQFCSHVEILYGKECCTPKLHLHLHLKQCFIDYGPPHAFRCFSFERYNGILGSCHANKKNIASQFMQKFLIVQAVHSLNSLCAMGHFIGFYVMLPLRHGPLKWP